MDRNFKRCHGAAIAMLAILSSYELAPASLADQSARDMFYQQLKEPSQPSNIGMSYWIELHRNGKLMRVDSRCAFRTGDKIKFHITPDIDGHAHIVLLRGSSGAKSVLFPVPGKDPSNVVHHGRDCAVPSTTFLVFDQTKGREHVRIALSRRNVNPAEFLKPQSSTQLAMASISSNPAVDPTGGQDQIHIALPEEASPSLAVSAPANDSNSDAIPNDNADSSRDMFREDSAPHRSTQHTAPHRHATGSLGHSASHSHHVVANGSHGSSASPSPAPPAIVVLNTNTNEDLYADISLQHN